MAEYKYRKACDLGYHWISYGEPDENGISPIESCICGTYAVCEHCDMAHIWVNQCRRCGALRAQEKEESCGWTSPDYRQCVLEGGHGGMHNFSNGAGNARMVRLGDEAIREALAGKKTRIV